MGAFLNDNIIAIIALLFSIISFRKTNLFNKEMKKIERPLNWSIEVHNLSLTYDKHKERFNEFKECDNTHYYLFKTPIPLDNEMQKDTYNSNLEELNSLNEFKDFLIIRNNLGFRISIDEFQKGKEKFYLGNAINPNETIIIAYETFFKPSIVIINGCGTKLPFDLKEINSTGNAIRPNEPL